VANIYPKEKPKDQAIVGSTNTRLAVAVLHLLLEVTRIETALDSLWQIVNMDSAEPEQTPFAAVSAQTSRVGRVSLMRLDMMTICWLMEPLSLRACR